MFFSNPFGLRWYWVWFALGVGWVALVWYLSLASDLPIPGVEIQHVDKAGHLLAYACLMGWFGNLTTRRRSRVLLAGGLVLMGIGLEYLQGLGAQRAFEYADMLANTLGVVLGYILTRGPLQRILKKLEDSWLKRA